MASVLLSLSSFPHPKSQPISTLSGEICVTLTCNHSCSCAQNSSLAPSCHKRKGNLFLARSMRPSMMWLPYVPGQSFPEYAPDSQATHCGSPSSPLPPLPRFVPWANFSTFCSSSSAQASIHLLGKSFLITPTLPPRSLCPVSPPPISQHTIRDCLYFPSSRPGFIFVSFVSVYI